MYVYSLDNHTFVPAPLFACTNAVVAICVVLVPTVAVGAAGIPVNVGEASAARVVSVGCICPSRANLPLSAPAVAVPLTKGVALDAIE
ncbi:hypothetical protein JBW_02192 [Pelosinus fermentans JBW45]|uniref:Uncharacterized protein n=1 Tax=Pelosinus fermentans JBW45 TaxID=1192197 RepID=I9NQY8_9FIRM|nr:hypothetical protein JBW_02192 [Pelosinus fermentans JBW45]